MRALRLTLIAAFTLSGCRNAPSPAPHSDSEPHRLPTGAHLDPAGRITEVGSFPLAMAPSPDGSSFAILLNGFRENGVQIIDRASGAVKQTLTQPAAFIGLAFSPDGKHLYASGGNGDNVYIYDWTNGRATLADSVAVAVKKNAKDDATRYPAGIGVSPDGSLLYVAENIGDSLAVLDIASKQVTQRLATERYPYGVAVANDGTVYVSAWGGSTISVFTSSGKSLAADGRITVSRHPSALLLSKDGSKLYAASASMDAISVVDTRAKSVVATINDVVPGNVKEGSTPNALALSPDGTRLYIAEADNNAVAIASLADNSIIGRVPTAWYPSAVFVDHDSLFVVNAKGKGTASNHWGPGRWGMPKVDPHQRTLGQLNGSVMMMKLPSADELTALTTRVAGANGWGDVTQFAGYPPIEHVIYVIKENRTYDQVFGDLTQADGDTSLVFFPRPVSPNQHALGERFGIFDRFFVNAEVSADGHNWSTAAYASDYVEKTVQQNYSDRGRTYDYEGTNREEPVDDDVNEPGQGYLWNRAEKAGITFRNYGEFAYGVGTKNARKYRGSKPYLLTRTNEDYPTFDMDIRDQRRMDVWLAEFKQFEEKGEMPALEIVRLPNDHTSGGTAGKPTPQAYMADNDLALGRMIEALSNSKFWRNTAVFVLEDDAQNGSDHVDAHRSPMIVISPWTKGGVLHRFANTSDVIATIEEILKLGTMSQFDHYGRPLREIWRSSPDLAPYKVIVPSVSLDEKNPRSGALAEESKKLALQKEDMSDDDLFNRILWKAIKGDRPMPKPATYSSIRPY